MRFRGPAGRGAGPHRENWPEVGVPQAVPAIQCGSAIRGTAALTLAWPASSVRVSRSRAMPVGDRRSAVPAILRGRRCANGAQTPGDASRRVPPPAAWRAGTGTPTSGRHSPPEAGGGKDPDFGGGSPLGRDPDVQHQPDGRLSLRFAQRCRPPPGELAGGRRSKPSPRFCAWWRTAEREKNKWQRTSGSLPAISGECVKGGILPFHIPERGESRAHAGAGATGFGVTRSAGFALPRDAGRRPALQGAASLGRVSRSRAMPVGDRRSWGGVVGAGFALTRDAGRRPALLASLARVSRSRAMPVGDRRSCPSFRTAPSRR